MPFTDTHLSPYLLDQNIPITLFPTPVLQYIFFQFVISGPHKSSQCIYVTGNHYLHANRLVTVQSRQWPGSVFAAAGRHHKLICCGRRMLCFLITVIIHCSIFCTLTDVISTLHITVRTDALFCRFHNSGTTARDTLGYGSFPRCQE